MPTAERRDHESSLLREIGAIADRTRELRRADAVLNHDQVKALTRDLECKWQELRILRAGPPDPALAARGARGSYS
jgi:hypothetical protein